MQSKLNKMYYISYVQADITGSCEIHLTLIISHRASSKSFHGGASLWGVFKGGWGGGSTEHLHTQLHIIYHKHIYHMYRYVKWNEHVAAIQLSIILVFQMKMQMLWQEGREGFKLNVKTLYIKATPHHFFFFFWFIYWTLGSSGTSCRNNITSFTS